MALEMVVVEDFGRYITGTHITDPAAIEALRANPVAQNRVQLVIAPDPEPQLDAPTASKAEPSSDPAPAPKA